MTLSLMSTCPTRTWFAEIITRHHPQEVGSGVAASPPTRLRREPRPALRHHREHRVREVSPGVGLCEWGHAVTTRHKHRDTNPVDRVNASRRPELLHHCHEERKG